MKIRKWVDDVVYYDELRGDDSFGHWEEEELDDGQVKEAVMDYLWKEHFWSKYNIPYKEVKQIIVNLYKDISDRCDITEIFAEEIAEYYGGKI